MHSACLRNSRFVLVSTVSLRSRSFGTGLRHDLNTLLEPSDHSLFKLNAAFAINSEGDIVGYGEDNFGNTEAFLLTPHPAVPEPSTWAVMLLGFAGLGFMTYRRTKKSAAV